MRTLRPVTQTPAIDLPQVVRELSRPARLRRMVVAGAVVLVLDVGLVRDHVHGEWIGVSAAVAAFAAGVAWSCLYRLGRPG